MIAKKKYIAKIGSEYIIDKKVRRDKKTGKIKWITFISCENIKPKGAVKFYEDEMKWLQENNPELEWEEEDG